MFKAIVLASLPLVTSLSFAATDKVFCPAVLSASGLDLGISKDKLPLLYGKLGADGSWSVKQESEQNVSTLTPLQTRKFKISIEEQGADGTAEAKKIIDCPVPVRWQVRTLPKLQFGFPEAIKNENKSNSIKFEKTVNGLTLDSMIGDKETLNINIFWRYFQPNLDTRFEIPDFLNEELVSRTSSTFEADETSPTIGIRFSDSQKFMNLWHLFTPKDEEFASESRKSFLALDDESSNYFKADLKAASQATLSVSQLTYWDSQKQKAITCTAAGNLSDPNSCFKLNYRVYKPVLDAVDAGRQFYIQTVVKLNEGFLLSTYQVNGAKRTNELVRTEYLPDLSLVGLPAEEWQP